MRHFGTSFTIFSGPIRNEPHPTDQQQALSIHIPYLDYVLEIPEVKRSYSNICEWSYLRFVL